MLSFPRRPRGGVGSSPSGRSGRMGRGSRRSLAGCLGVAGCLLVAACGGGQLSVNMVSVKSNISFGLVGTAHVVVPPIVSALAPSSVFGEQPGGVGGAPPAPDLEPDLGSSPSLASLPSLYGGGPAAPTGPCPSAPPGTFPTEAATSDPTGPPQPGNYRWKFVVPGKRTALVEHRIFDESAVVRDPLSSTGGQVFTFDEMVPYQGYNIVTTYQVKTGAPRVTENLSQYGTNIDLEAGTPDRGLSIVRVQEVDEAGNPVGSAFTPTPPVLLLPLPLELPDSFEGIGTDPTSGTTLTNVASVVGRARIDACGQIVDGWQVTGTETYLAPGVTLRTTVTYNVATQLGGMLDYLAQVPVASVGEAVTATTQTLGQVAPTAPASSSGS